MCVCVGGVGWGVGITSALYTVVSVHTVDKRTMGARIITFKSYPPFPPPTSFFYSKPTSADSSNVRCMIIGNGNVFEVGACIL